METLEIITSKINLKILNTTKVIAFVKYPRDTLYYEK